MADSWALDGELRLAAELTWRAWVAGYVGSYRGRQTTLAAGHLMRYRMIVNDILDKTRKEPIVTDFNMSQDFPKSTWEKSRKTCLSAVSLRTHFAA
jgi:hypothetical protein